MLRWILGRALVADLCCQVIHGHELNGFRAEETDSTVGPALTQHFAKNQIVFGARDQTATPREQGDPLNRHLVIGR